MAEALVIMIAIGARCFILAVVARLSICWVIACALACKIVWIVAILDLAGIDVP
jgi:hypothetical protein